MSWSIESRLSGVGGSDSKKRTGSRAVCLPVTLPPSLVSTMQLDATKPLIAVLTSAVVESRSMTNNLRGKRWFTRRLHFPVSGEYYLRVNQQFESETLVHPQIIFPGNGKMEATGSHYEGLDRIDRSEERRVGKECRS